MYWRFGTSAAKKKNATKRSLPIKQFQTKKHTKSLGKVGIKIDNHHQRERGFGTKNEAKRALVLLVVEKFGQHACGVLRVRQTPVLCEKVDVTLMGKMTEAKQA